MELIRDGNRITVAGGQSSTDATAVLPFKIDPVTGRLLTDTAAGSGSVTNVSVVSANGFAGSVATPTTTPAITLSTTITGLLKGNGTAISAATPGTDYEVPLTFSTGLTRTVNTVTVNTSQNIATLSNLTSNGLVTTSGGAGTLSVTVPGTGVLTALGVNVGSAGAVVTFNGALGTPSSGTLTNATGLPIAGLVSSTSTALGVGSIELGAASDTTIARVSAGVISVEGATVATLSATQTFTATQTVNLLNTTPQTLTVAANAATADITHGIQNFTNSSAATMTITLTTTSAVDGQWKEVRIYDFSAVAQTISWVNTENSSVSVPTTSNGSTTLPLSILFQFNSATSKWRCVATA